MVDNAARRMRRTHASSIVGARGSKPSRIAEGKWVRAIVGRSPSRFEIGEAKSEEAALKMNGMARSDERRLIGASKREWR